MEKFIGKNLLMELPSAGASREIFLITAAILIVIVGGYLIFSSKKKSK